MGGKKNQPRAKGNAKPASSDRTALLLSNSGATVPGLTAFFPTLKPLSTNTDNEVEVTVDSEFRAALKRLTKKDAITRLKALQDFTALVRQKEEQDESLRGMLPFWPRNFNRLAVDNDHRVREAAFHAHKSVVERVKKNLAPFMKTILSTWLCGMFDTYAPASTAAKQAFEAAFPTFKHPQVFLFFGEEISSNFQENLFTLTPQTVPDALDLDENERLTKYHRIIEGTLAALRHFLRTVNVEENKAKIEELFSPFVSNTKFWKLGRHTDPGIRGGLYSLLSTIVEVGIATEDSVEKVTKCTLSNLAEKDPVVCSTIWECALTLLNKYPDCWRHVNIQKAFIPQLNSVLKNRAFGTAATTFTILLPMYSLIPEVHLYRDFILANLKEGLTVGVTNLTPLSELNAVVEAYMEILRYSLIQQASSTQEILKILNDHMMPLLKEVLTVQTEAHLRVSNTRLFTEVLSLLLFMEKRGKEQTMFAEASQNIWSQIQDFCSFALNEGKNLNVLSDFFVTLNSEISSDSVKVKKGVRFATGDENTKIRRKRAISPSRIDDVNKQNVRFLRKVLDKVMEEKSVSSVKLFADIFTLCCDQDFIRLFEAEALNGATCMEKLITPWLSEEDDLLPFVAMVALRVAAHQSEVTQGVHILRSIQSTSSTMLLLVLLEAALNWSPALIDLLQSYLSSEMFLEHFELDDPIKWEILAASFDLVSRNSSLMSKANIKACMDNMQKCLEDVSNEETVAHVGEVCHVLLESYDGWKKVDCIKEMVFSLYQVTTSLSDLEGAQKLREIWTAAVCGSDEDSMSLRRRIAEDLCRRICSATPSEIEPLILNCLELHQRVGDLEYLSTILPSEENLMKMTTELNILVCMVSDICSDPYNKPYVIHTSDYISDHKLVTEKFISTCMIMLRVGKEADCAELMQLHFAFLARTFQNSSCLAPLLLEFIQSSSKAMDILTQLIIKCNDSSMWLLAVDQLLNVVKEREFLSELDLLGVDGLPPEFQQLLIKYEKDTKNVASILHVNLADLVYVEEVETELIQLNLISKCIQHCTVQDETGELVSKLVSHLQGRKGQKPELYQCDQPSIYQVCLARFFLAVTTHCPHVLTKLNWDFVLLTTASFIEKFPWNNPCENVNFVQLATTLLDLFIVVDKVVHTDVEDIVENLPANIKTEWSEFYGSVVFNKLLPILALSTPKKVVQNIPAVILRSLAPCLSLLKTQQILSLWPDKEENSPHQILQKLCSFILSKSTSVQLAAYAVALGLCEKVANNLDEEADAMKTEDFDEDNDLMPEKSIMNCLLDVEPFMDDVLDGEYLETSYEISDKESAGISAVLLSWSLVVNFCNKTSRQHRYRYHGYLEANGTSAKFLQFIFNVMPKYAPSNAFEDFLPKRNASVVQIACAVYLESCFLAPAVVRNWYTSAQSIPKKAAAIERFTTKNVSCILIERIMSSVRQMTKTCEGLDNIRISAIASSGEIRVSYSFEETSKTVDLPIYIWPSYPLKHIKVDAQEKAVRPVSEVLWNQWLRDVAMFLNNKNGSIQEAVIVWKQNIDKKIEGVQEECTICFCVIHMTTTELPKYPCRTCKKKFHMYCIYKWFRQGHATCPLCRSVMI